MADPATPSFTPDLLALTAQIVAAHVAANTVPTDALSDLIRGVHDALVNVAAPTSAAPPAQEPAVPIKRSVQRDYLVCLEDGAKMKMLTRYLKARFGLTPDAYRAKWGLPRDYPMVAPAYTARRSELAKQFELGTALRTVVQSAPAAATPQPEMPTVLAEPEVQHTAASVFANFPRGDVAAEVSDGVEKQGRKGYAQQLAQVGRRRSATRPM